jgi:O-antigen/teichoic acid export membrane protein
MEVDDRHSQDPPIVRPSLARSSVARFGASIAVLTFGFISSVVTARILGPASKGALSALSFLGDIFFFYICGLGLGEAAIILIGQRRATLQRALSAGLAALFITGILGMAGLLIASVPAQWSGIMPAVILQGCALILALYQMYFISLLNARERFGATSSALSLRSFLTAIGTVLFVAVIPLGIEGALLGAVLATAAAVALLAVALRRLGLSFRPTLDREFLRSALRFGIVLQLSYLAMAASQRVDQLIVYSFISPNAGGVYAVALTLGQLPAFIPGALSNASFPRLAHLSEDEVWPLTAQTARIGLVGGALAAVALMVAIPFLTSLTFGHRYEQAIVPAMILVPGGLIWSQQWILARAWAARGRPSLFLRTYVVAVAVMLGLDAILLPLAGIKGAALASVVGAIVGLGLCLRAYSREVPRFRARELVPRGEDLHLLLNTLRQLATGRSSA